MFMHYAASDYEIATKDVDIVDNNINLNIEYLNEYL